MSHASGFLQASIEIAVPDKLSDVAVKKFGEESVVSMNFDIEKIKDEAKTLIKAQRDEILVYSEGYNIIP